MQRMSMFRAYAPGRLCCPHWCDAVHNYACASVFPALSIFYCSVVQTYATCFNYAVFQRSIEKLQKNCENYFLHIPRNLTN